jgi:hypothetical protein
MLARTISASVPGLRLFGQLMLAKPPRPLAEQLLKPGGAGRIERPVRGAQLSILPHTPTKGVRFNHGLANV